MTRKERIDPGLGDGIYDCAHLDALGLMAEDVRAYYHMISPNSKVTSEGKMKQVRLVRKQKGVDA